MANEKIMIVDDDLDMLEVLGLYLEKEGFIVRKTRVGRSTIEISLKVYYLTNILENSHVVRP